MHLLIQKEEEHRLTCIYGIDILFEFGSWVLNKGGGCCCIICNLVQQISSVDYCIVYWIQFKTFLPWHLVKPSSSHVDGYDYFHPSK